MKKSEFIERYDEAAWERKLERDKIYYEAHREERKARNLKWKKANPKKQKENNQEISRKGGKYYERALIAKRTGIAGEKSVIRATHNKQYRPFKNIIAPESQIHHEWIPETAEYRGLALVEANPHRYSIIDVILILDGEITLLTEEEIRKRATKED